MEKKIEQNLRVLDWLEGRSLEVEFTQGEQSFRASELDTEERQNLLADSTTRVFIKLGRGCVALHAKNKATLSTFKGLSGLSASLLRGNVSQEAYFLYKLDSEQWGKRQESVDYVSPDEAVQFSLVGEHGLIPAPFITYDGRNEPDYAFRFDGYDRNALTLWYDTYWKKFTEIAFDHFGKPVPLLGSDVALPVCADEMIPTSVRPYVLHKADQFAAQKEGILMAVVTSVATLVGAKLSVFPLSKNRSWQEHTVVRFMLAFLSGSAKTDAMQAGLSFLLAIEDDGLRKWEAEQKKFGKEIKKLEKEKKNRDTELETTQSNLRRLEARKRVFEREGDAKKLGDLIFQIEEEKELALLLKQESIDFAKELGKMTDSKPPRYTTTDVTPEKADVLMSENQNGMANIQDEMSGLLWSMEGPGGERVRNLLQSSSKGTVSVKTDRISRGLTSVSGQRLHIYGLIQPDKLSFYLNHQRNRGKLSDGTVTRFMTFVSNHMPEYDLSKVDTESDDGLTDELDGVFALLKDFDPQALGKNLVEHRGKLFIHFSPESQGLFKEWLTQNSKLVARVTQFNKPLSSYTKKLPHHVCVLALVFHILDWAKLAVKGKAVGDFSYISTNALQMALAWAEMSQVHAESLYKEASDTALTMARAIIDKIECGKIDQGMTVRQVMKKQMEGFDRSEDIKAGFGLLATRNIARITRVKTGAGPGNKTELIQIHPDILKSVAANSGISESLLDQDAVVTPPPIFQTKWLNWTAPMKPQSQGSSDTTSSPDKDDATFADVYGDSETDDSAPEADESQEKLDTTFAEEYGDEEATDPGIEAMESCPDFKNPSRVYEEPVSDNFHNSHDDDDVIDDAGDSETAPSENDEPVSKDTDPDEYDDSEATTEPESPKDSGLATVSDSEPAPTVALALPANHRYTLEEARRFFPDILTEIAPHVSDELLLETLKQFGRSTHKCKQEVWEKDFEVVLRWAGHIVSLDETVVSTSNPVPAPATDEIDREIAVHSPSDQPETVLLRSTTEESPLIGTPLEATDQRKLTFKQAYLFLAEILTEHGISISSGKVRTWVRDWERDHELSKLTKADWKAIFERSIKTRASSVDPEPKSWEVAA